MFISGLIFLAIIAISPIRKQDHCLHPRAPEGRHQRRYRPVHLPDRSAERRDRHLPANNLLDLSRHYRPAPALLALIGLIITGILMAWKVKGALFIGILVTTVIGIPMGVTNLSNVSISFEGISIAPTFFKLSFVRSAVQGHPAFADRHRDLRHVRLL